jgi:hypothetical protein
LDRLSSQISDLQTEFRQLADRHPWVCLGIPPWDGPYGPVAAGEATSIHLAPHLGDPIVRTPAHPWLRPVIDHVNVLTSRAQQLLLRVFDFTHVLAPDLRHEIRTWESRRRGDGWVRWLWGAVPIRQHHRIQNYPQVAVAALSALRDAVELAAMAPSPERPCLVSLGNR